METDVRALGLNLPRSSGPILITSLSRTDATQRPDGERAIGKRLACNQAGADESDFPRPASAFDTWHPFFAVVPAAGVWSSIPGTSPSVSSLISEIAKAPFFFSM